MVSPLGVCSSFMVLSSPDAIYQLGFTFAIAMLSSNTVDILQLSSFQGKRIEECKPRSASHVTGDKVWWGHYTQMAILYLRACSEHILHCTWGRLGVGCVRRCREEAWRKTLGKGRLERQGNYQLRIHKIQPWVVSCIWSVKGLECHIDLN